MTEDAGPLKRRQKMSKAQLIEELATLDQKLTHAQSTASDIDDFDLEDARRFEMFSKASPGWFWEMDENLRFTYVSPRVEEMLGIPAEFHIGKTRAELAGEAADTPEWQKHLADLEAHRPFRDFCYFRKGHDGRLQFLAITGNPVFDSAGRFRGYAGISEDRTEQEGVKENLRITRDSYRETEDRLQNAIEAIDGGFVIYDSDDRFVMSNTAYKDVFRELKPILVPGTPFEEIARQGAEQGIFDQARGREEEWVASRLKMFREASSGDEMQLSDGRWIRFEDRKTASSETVGIQTDITDVKITQVDLENARVAAEQANLAKTRFLATMSHEIRTPLNGVLGMAQMLSRTDLGDEQRKLLDTILSSGAALLVIINDVLDMSKIEAGGLELESAAFNFPNLVTGIKTSFLGLTDDKGLKLITMVNLKKTQILRGDSVRVRQIIWNLLSNAIKFTDQGSVHLEIREIPQKDSPLVDRKDHTIRITVKDTGLGISTDRLPAIFDAFTQEDNSITRKFGGTGLGLSIVKQLTDLMGGTISVESAVTQGARFDVYLPFEKTTRKEVDNLPSMDASVDTTVSGPWHILVVEDNEVNAMIAESFLQKSGHRVEIAKNGRLAIESVRKQLPDLVLMDIHMPEVDGVLATRMLRSMDTCAGLPIIGLTAEAFAERHAGFIAAGMDYVLTKPFTEEQLDAVISRFAPISGRDENPDAGERAALSVKVEETSAVIGDEARLIQMIDSLGLDKVGPLLEYAPVGLRARCKALHDGLDSDDADAVYAAAHAIKGTSGSLYARRLPEAAAGIEEAVSDLNTVRDMMVDFDVIVEDTIKWWQFMVHSGQGG